MTRRLFPLFAFVCLVLATLPANAQDGCVDSPECPTALLALVGVAGATLYNRFKR